MVDQEHLEALDAMLWMASSHRAAAIVHANQSTVIRRACHVLSIFGGDVERGSSGWRIRNTSSLLRMERQVHQLFRFRGSKPLRLHAQFWTSRGLQQREIPHWIFNPSCEFHSCANPLELLTERIIDACLLSPPQAELISPAQANQPMMLPLYHGAINLVVWPWQDAASVAPASRPAVSSNNKSSRFQLHLFPFFSDPCRTKSQLAFQMLDDRHLQNMAVRVDGDSGLYEAAFLTHEMHRSLRLPPHVLDDSLPCPYTETLVFLAEHAGEPSMHQLVDTLRHHFSGLPRCG
jgi:hypothetical protein